MISKAKMKELAVLGAVRLNANLPLKRIAKKLGMKVFTLQRTLKNLKDREIIKPYLLINPHSLGLNDFCLFFNMSNSTSKTRAQLISHCKNSPYVAFFSELTGEYQYSVSIFSKTVETVEDFLSSLNENKLIGSTSHAFALRTNWTLYSNVKGKSDALVREGGRRAQIDELDKRILREYSLDCAVPLARIAAKTSIAEATVRFRLQKLMKSGVLMGMPYFVDWACLGYHPMRILVSLQGASLPQVGRLAKLAKSDICITESVRCLGAWDFELNFHISEPQQTSVLIQKIHELFEGTVLKVSACNEQAVHVLHRFPEYLLKG